MTADSASSSATTDAKAGVDVPIYSIHCLPKAVDRFVVCNRSSTVYVINMQGQVRHFVITYEIVVCILIQRAVAISFCFYTHRLFGSSINNLIYYRRVGWPVFCNFTVIYYRRVAWPVSCNFTVIYYKRVPWPVSCNFTVIYYKRVAWPVSCNFTVIYYKRVAWPISCNFITGESLGQSLVISL